MKDYVKKLEIYSFRQSKRLPLEMNSLINSFIFPQTVTEEKDNRKMIKKDINNYEVGGKYKTKRHGKTRS